MKYLISILLFVCCVPINAQLPWKPDKELEKQLQESNYVHRILKANPEHAGLTRWYKKEVLKSRELPLAEDFASLRHTGREQSISTGISQSQEKAVFASALRLHWVRRIRQTRSMSVSGGWHDAADLTQGTGNSAESGIALLEMANAVQGKDSRMMTNPTSRCKITVPTRKFGRIPRQG